MDFLRKLRKWSDTQQYPAQTDIFLQGEAAETLYIVISGEVELTLSDDVLSTESEGAIIGEMTLIEGALQGAKASTLTEVKLAKFSREQLHTLMKENSEFSLHLMNILARRLRLVHEYTTTDFDQKPA